MFVSYTLSLNQNCIYNQARILEFSSGGGGVGPTLRKNFDKQKKKKINKKKRHGEGRALQYLFCISTVEI